MKKAVRNYAVFLGRCASIAFEGDWRYYTWMGLLSVISLVGLNAYAKQLVHGLSVTGMTDQVSWGVYIANFTFVDGIAAAAVMIVIPAFIYRNQALKDLVIFGQLLAVAAIIMCLAFVTVDIGRPERFWHLIPFLGKLNFPQSLLSWDVVVLNGYLLLNLHICGYLIYCRYQQREPARWFYTPFVATSIIWAVCVQAVAAFLYVGLGGRPFWNSAIVGPRFIASAFSAGPALIILALQIIRRFTTYRIDDKAIFTLRSIVQVSMLVNVFLLGNELFKEFYTASLQVEASVQYLFFGLHGHNALVPWIWTAIAFNLISVTLLVLPASRKLFWLDLACILAVVGSWIEKGMGVVIPAFVPTPLGEIVEYSPTLNETLVCLGIWAFGLLIYTVCLRMSVPVLQGKLTQANESPASPA